jgi:anti-sigma B factor antagonist
VVIQRLEPAAELLSVSISLGIDRARLHLRGELDMASAPMLNELLDEAIDDGGVRSTVLIDVTDLTYCDSSGIRALLEAARRCYKNGAYFRVVGARSNVRRVFEITDTIAILNVDGCADPPP